jgi:hypothetical protein
MKTKTMLPVMLLMGTVALGVGQNIQQPATLQVIDGLTTQISVTLRLTAGSHSINGGKVQYFKRHGIVHEVSFSDVLQPFESLEFTVDQLECDTGYRFREKSTTDEPSTGVATLTAVCEFTP